MLGKVKAKGDRQIDSAFAFFLLLLIFPYPLPTLLANFRKTQPVFGQKNRASISQRWTTFMLALFALNSQGFRKIPWGEVGENLYPGIPIAGDTALPLRIGHSPSIAPVLDVDRRYRAHTADHHRQSWVTGIVALAPARGALGFYKKKTRMGY